MTNRAPLLTSRMREFGETIFAEMSALAVATASINLGQGFPDTDGPQEVSDAAIAAIRAGHNQYPPGPGIPELRRAIVHHQRHWYGIELDPDTDVLVTAGATEAIAAAILALCEPGDEVVTFEPYYDSYAACIALAGAQRRVVQLRTPDYAFDPDELARAITSRTRLLLLNSPHNPTGKVFSRAELDVIAQLCVEHDLIAVTDEVYEHLVFEGEHVPLATLPGMRDRTLTISSGGKTFSFTGWKVGWVSGTAELVTAVRTVKQFLTYVNGAPFQHAIAVGLGRVLERLHLVPRQDIDEPFGQPRQPGLGGDRFPLAGGPGQEVVDRAHVGVDGVGADRAAGASAGVHQLGREAVQDPVVDLGHLGDLLRSAEGEEDVAQRVPVGALDGARGETPGPAGGQVVVDEPGDGWRLGAGDQGQIGHLEPLMGEITVFQE